jgi:AraC-like DNA-binding protein
LATSFVRKRALPAAEARCSHPDSSKRRLTRCHRDVTDPAMRCRPLGEIAFAAGFNDLSHFSRAYRARYGCTPRDARRHTLATRWQPS